MAHSPVWILHHFVAQMNFYVHVMRIEPWFTFGLHDWLSFWHYEFNVIRITAKQAKRISVADLKIFGNFEPWKIYRHFRPFQQILKKYFSNIFTYIFNNDRCRTNDFVYHPFLTDWFMRSFAVIFSWKSLFPGQN